MSYKCIRPLLALKGLTLITTFKDDELCSGWKRSPHRKLTEPSKYELDVHNTIRSVSQKIEHDLLLIRGAPGVTVGVAHNGRVIWKAGLGYSDVENLVPCHPDAVMRIASISKTVTMSTIVAKMLEEGKLNLDDSIHKYLNEEEFPRQNFNGKKCDIKLRHLLSNTSGIRHYGERGPQDPDDVGKPTPICWPTSTKILQTISYYTRTGPYERTVFRNVMDSLALFKNDDLACEPGSKYVYSTQGWVLVSAIVQKALSNNNTFEAEFLKLLRNELKLDNIFLELEEPMVMFRSKQYQRSGRLGRLVNVPAVHQSNKWAGGGMLSNVEDLLKLGSMLIDSYKGRPNAYLKSATVKEMWRDQSNGAGYGFGFRVPDNAVPQNSTQEFYVYHTGAAVGGSSILTIFPDSEIVVCIIVNVDDVNLKSLSLDIAKAFASLLGDNRGPNCHNSDK